jgi:hypothetical protein
MKQSTLNPISPKVYGAVSASSLLTFITWGLTTFVPAFHSGIPPALASLLPGIVGAFLGAGIGGYVPAHNVTPIEFVTAIKNVDTLYDVIHPSLEISGSVEHLAPASPLLPSKPESQSGSSQPSVSVSGTVLTTPEDKTP